MKGFLLALLCLAPLASAPLRASGYGDAPVIGSTVPWRIGERFVFKINYGIINAGVATIELRETVDLAVSSGAEKRTAYHIVATARSNKFVDGFYKVRDQNESWLDVERWLSHRFEQHNQEGKYILDQIVEYDWRNMWFRNQENVKGRAPKVEEGPLTVPAVDTLSVLYLARAKALDVGTEFTMNVHSGRNWPLLLKVLKREKVKVPAGTFDCIMVEPYLTERGIFVQKGKRIQVWLTADERRIPVMMRAEIFIGAVSAELVEAHGVQ